MLGGAQIKGGNNAPFESFESNCNIFLCKQNIFIFNQQSFFCIVVINKGISDPHNCQCHLLIVDKFLPIEVYFSLSYEAVHVHAIQDGHGERESVVVALILSVLL